MEHLMLRDTQHDKLSDGFLLCSVTLLLLHLPFVAGCCPELEVLFLTPAVSAWRAECDFPSFFLKCICMCQKSTSEKLDPLMMPGQCSSPTSQRGAQELPAPPSFCQACSTVGNLISLSLGRFPDGTDLINCFFPPLNMHMLFLLGFMFFFFFSIC